MRLLVEFVWLLADIFNRATNAISVLSLFIEITNWDEVFQNTFVFDSFQRKSLLWTVVVTCQLWSSIFYVSIEMHILRLFKLVQKIETLALSQKYTAWMFGGPNDDVAIALMPRFRYIWDWWVNNCVFRRYHEFYVLEQKLEEFHGKTFFDFQHLAIRLFHSSVTCIDQPSNSCRIIRLHSV